MITGSVMIGNAEFGRRTCGPAPARAKWMRSGPPELAVLSAANSDSRREMDPSGPGLATRDAIDDVLPSATSLTVFTLTTASSCRDSSASMTSRRNRRRLAEAPRTTADRVKLMIGPHPNADS
jgi:hypothetical protein